MTYKEKLSLAMELLGHLPNTIFIGQGVKYGGVFTSDTLKNVSENKLIEFPVNEALQAQFSVGLAMDGYIPITIFPRQNFLLLALADLINVADKLYFLSEKKKYPKLIIRTAVGTTKPIYPGIQHASEFNEALKLMFDNTEVIELTDKDKIVPSYLKAYSRQDGLNTLLIEYGDLYNE